MLSEVSQMAERQIAYGITYRWNRKYDANEPIYEVETDSHRQQIGVYQGGGGWGRDEVRGWG